MTEPTLPLVAACQKIEKLKRCLEDFVSTIDCTGGVIEDRNGNLVPATDEDWVDLGDAYVKACELLDRKPLVGE